MFSGKIQGVTIGPGSLLPAEWVSGPASGGHVGQSRCHWLQREATLWRLERPTWSSVRPGRGDAHTRKVPSRTDTLPVGEREDSAGNARSHWVRLWGSSENS